MKRRKQKKNPQGLRGDSEDGSPPGTIGFNLPSASCCPARLSAICIQIPLRFPPILPLHRPVLHVQQSADSPGDGLDSNEKQTRRCIYIHLWPFRGMLSAHFLPPAAVRQGRVKSDGRSRVLESEGKEQHRKIQLGVILRCKATVRPPLNTLEDWCSGLSLSLSKWAKDETRTHRHRCQDMMSTKAIISIPLASPAWEGRKQTVSITEGPPLSLLHHALGKNVSGKQDFRNRTFSEYIPWS